MTSNLGAGHNYSIFVGGQPPYFGGVKIYGDENEMMSLEDNVWKFEMDKIYFGNKSSFGSDFTFSAGQSDPSDDDGLNLIIEGGLPWDSGSITGNGGNVTLRSGSNGGGSGNDGNVIIDSLTGSIVLLSELPNDDTATQIIVRGIDGVLKYRDVSSISSSGYTSGGTGISVSSFNFYSGSTVPNTYLRKSTFTTYSGVTNTLIGTKLSTSTYATYTGNTNTLIGTKLSNVNFQTYTGTTEPARYASKIAGNTFTGGKNTFTTTATGAGINVGSYAGSPTSNLADGDIWYTSTTNRFLGRRSNSTVSWLSCVEAGFTLYRVPISSGGANVMEHSGFTFNTVTRTLTANRLVTSPTAAFAGVNIGGSLSTVPTGVTTGDMFITSNVGYMRVNGSNVDLTTPRVLVSNFNTYSAATNTTINTKADKLATFASAGNYTISNSDSYRIIEVTGTSTITIPSGLTTGLEFFINNIGVGVVTLAAGSGMTLELAGTQIATQWSGAGLYIKGNKVRGFGNLTLP